MRNLNQVLLSVANATQTQTTPAIEGAQLYRASFHAVFSDNACTGTLKLQASNELTSPASFSTVSTTNVTAGGSVLIPSTELSYQYIQVLYTPTAGAGTVTVYINAQGF